MRSRKPRLLLEQNSLALALSGIVLLLMGLGTLWVFSASAVESLELYGNQFSVVRQHVIGLAVGLFGLCCAALTPPAWWKRLAPFAFWGSVGLLLLVLVPGIGVELNGARRWLSIAGILFQPVELLKLAIILFGSSWLSQHQRIGPLATMLGIPSILILLQPDLGSTLIIVALGVSLFFIAGGSSTHLTLLAALVIPLVLVLIVISPYRLERLATFLNPNLDPLGSSFHARQNTLALAQGGLFGQGLGNSTQKFAYIPETSTDSVFAIVGEEVGFIGSATIICLFVVLIWILSKVAALQPDTMGQLLVYGVAVWIGLQVIVNIGAVTALMPLTGTPLPFFSYGRTAQVAILCTLGIALRRAWDSRMVSS
jgi:cell division protein FtsW